MRIKILLILAILYHSTAFSQQSFPYEALTGTGDMSALMVEGISRFLTVKTNEAKKQRSARWSYDFSSAEKFITSTKANRELLAERLGVKDKRSAPDLQIISGKSLNRLTIAFKEFSIHAVRWKVLDDLWAEGILLQPKNKVTARIVMLPDADMVPEVLAGITSNGSAGFRAAQRLSLSGAQVIIPVLVSRSTEHSGNPALNKHTDQPHREWIYRQAYELGRHVIGYELQKIVAALDWFDEQNKEHNTKTAFGVAGFGEGGMLALYAAALDRRIKSTIVSGYFNERENLYAEPIYRNVFGLLNTFGDAELAVMAWPNKVIVEHCGAAPGKIDTKEKATAHKEWEIAKSIVPANNINVDWLEAKRAPFAEDALSKFCQHLNLPKTILPVQQQQISNPWIDPDLRQQRTVNDIVRNVQRTLQLSSGVRDKNFWATLKGDTLADVQRITQLRESFAEVIGSITDSLEELQPKARKINETDKFISYEVKLNVLPDVFAWGILMIPKNLSPGKKHPVVVCQHGLEGLPSDVITTDSTAENYHFYKGFGTRLCERGYITFSPHNPYRGGDKFRVLQRKANPIGLSLFSVITAQHKQILRWLNTLSFVDPKRIGFYGLSYGGKTAMRVPAQLKEYALSICSADFNEWVLKNATIDFDFSYLYTDEYEMPEWDLGHTFNYAEMAALIAPRPFMVERGSKDGVGIDEWVDYEFARIKKYLFSGRNTRQLPDRTFQRTPHYQRSRYI